MYEEVIQKDQKREDKSIAYDDLVVQLKNNF